MKIIIRRGVFETNSSSSHSISIASEDKEFVRDTLYPDQNGVVRVEGGEFGWEWFKHNDAETKASYVAQSHANDQDTLDKLADVIREQTGAEKVVFVGLEGGYVDHDSYGVAPKTSHEMKNFIFNKNSWLFGGNDNSDASPEFYHVPEFKNGRMILPVFKYELVIEGLEKKTRFLEYPNEENLESAINSVIDGALVTNSGHFLTDSSIMWQITRPRGEYYELGWQIAQDYSKGEIRFIKEDNNLYSELRKSMEEQKLFDGLDWKQRNILITEKLLQIPGIIKCVKFTINEIKND